MRAILGAAAACFLAGARQDEKFVTLTCRPPAARAPSSVLRFEGAAPLPDGAILKLTVLRHVEQPAAGRLETAAVEAGRGLASVKGGRFRYEPAWEGPGVYGIRVDLSDDYQSRAVREALPRDLKSRRWSFTFPGWGDDLVGRLGPALRETDGFVAEAGELIRKFERSCANADAWQSQQKALVQEAGAFRTKLEKAEAGRLYTASVSQLLFTVRNLLGQVPYFTWKDGTFTAVSYHNPDEPGKTFRQEEFTFANLRKYVDECRALAGREFALWALKDLRRAGPREALKEALKEQAGTPGAADFVGRLGEATPEEQDVLEKEIRGLLPSK
jgi:hypothetical protein